MADFEKKTLAEWRALLEKESKGKGEADLT